MAIQQIDGRLFGLQTQNTTYVLRIGSDGLVENVYWGGKTENLGDTSVVLERFYSAEYGLPGTGYESWNFGSRWASEFRAHSEPVKADGNKVHHVRLRGLKAYSRYTLTMDGKTIVKTGDYLMQMGLWAELKGDYDSLLIRITESTD